MSIIQLTLRCLFTPRLYKTYRGGSNANVYQPRKLEKWGDHLIISALALWKLSVYASPLICFFIYKRDLLSADNMLWLAKVLGAMGVAVASALLARALGRAVNPEYVQFMRALRTPDHAQRLDRLRQYDFEFYAFPTTYSSPRNLSTEYMRQRDARGLWVARSPLQVVAVIAVRTFGLRLIYPGTIGLVHSLVWSELVRGRAELVQTHGGQRHKLRTPDANEIDCMLVDNRSADRPQEGASKGSTLVICCEGNSGFYEIGIMGTPLAGGYSVLGWNHPGFAGSTGSPYPEQEQQAVETVMLFAVERLGFPLERIALFGWSIGGYAAAWAAVRYPLVRCLVLDATFDDLLPLATARMPASWRSLVAEVVRGHVDLNIGELLQDYPGELQLVRRTSDEIICLREGELSTNSVNELLLRVLRARHPRVMGERQTEAVRALLALHGASQLDLCRQMLDSPDPDTRSAVLMVQKYLKDYKSSHCTPLPLHHFTIP